MRHEAAPGHLLGLDAQPRRILRAEPAPFRSNAGFNSPQRLGIGMAADHTCSVQIGPDSGQILLLDAEDIEPLAASHLHHTRPELIDHIGNSPQFTRIGDAAPHARHHRVGAVLLDIGVHALVDEARLVVVDKFPRPGA